MNDLDAEVKAYEYAGAIVMKRLVQKYFPDWTVTPTTNYNNDKPCRCFFDYMLSRDDGSDMTVVEGKARTYKYRVNNPRIQDMAVNCKKFDNVKGCVEGSKAVAWYAGIYPLDDTVMIWDTSLSYEVFQMTKKKFERDPNSPLITEDMYRLKFDMATRYQVDCSDFEQNFRRAYRKYTGKEYTGDDFGPKII